MEQAEDTEKTDDASSIGCLALKSPALKTLQLGFFVFTVALERGLGAPPHKEGEEVPAQKS
jgi:hypothetical protein